LNLIEPRIYIEAKEIVAIKDGNLYKANSFKELDQIENACNLLAFGQNVQPFAN